MVMTDEGADYKTMSLSVVGESQGWDSLGVFSQRFRGLVPVMLMVTACGHFWEVTPYTS